MLSILIINSKGGSGKTTLTTNLASYYSSRKFRTTIMDYDPQGSCLQWLRVRPSHIGNIHGANAAPPKGASTLHNLQKWVPSGTEVLVIDAPSGVRGLLLQEMVRRANFILVPVVPSPIDIHATADFIKELFLIGGTCAAKTKISVVANRMRSTSPSRESLERFLASLKLPFLTSISDSDNYIRAAEKGLGVRRPVGLFGAGDDRIRDPPPGPTLEDVLLPQATKLAALREGRREREQTVIEEGVAAFDPMCHCHPIALTR